MDAKERPQNIVTFVSFREMDSQGQEETSQAIRIGGMDVLVNVDINNDVQAAVDLSADGNNQIDLKGGGNLTYTMNPLGDVRLSGKYVLSGGSVRYNPPIISQKSSRSRRTAMSNGSGTSPTRHSTSRPWRPYVPTSPRTGRTTVR